MAEYYRKKQPSCTTPDGREWFASGGGNTNPEYIEREAVREILERYQAAPHIKQKTHFSIGMLTAIIGCIELVGNVPAADVVPVVRCGECERRNKSADLTDTIYCPWLKLQMRKGDFCSYGERKDGDG